MTSEGRVAVAILMVVEFAGEQSNLQQRQDLHKSSQVDPSPTPRCQSLWWPRPTTSLGDRESQVEAQTRERGSSNALDGMRRSSNRTEHRLVALFALSPNLAFVASRPMQ
jgi:hypothetical protein